MENYVHIHTTTGRYLTHTTLKSVIENINAPEFIQTHKSYVINITRVTAVEGNTIEMGKALVPVSRGMKEEVVRKIVKDNLLKK